MCTTVFWFVRVLLCVKVQVTFVLTNANYTSQQDNANVKPNYLFKLNLIADSKSGHKILHHLTVLYTEY
jgi:hypothetical protein